MNRIRHYYERELTSLREQGKLFSKRFPKLAPFLGQGIKDPDIERLLEGFAFISGKLWAKIEDTYPELSEQFLALLAPSYFCVTPAATILQFQPNPGLGQKAKFIPRGTEILSLYQEEKYPFTLSYDLWVNPLEISAVSQKVKQGLTHLKIGFNVLYGAISTDLTRPFRFYLQGDLRETYPILYALKRQLKKIYIHINGARHPLDLAHFISLGFSATESLLPFYEEEYQSFSLLAEYFNFPEKFMFLELLGFELNQFAGVKNFELEFVLSVDERQHLSLRAEHFQLHAVPCINLFKANAEPLLHQGKKINYPLRADKGSHLAIHSVTQIEGFIEKEKKRFEYQPARDFPILQEEVHRYQTHLHASFVHDHPEVYLELWSPHYVLDTQLISIEILAYQPNAFLEVNGTQLLSSEKGTVSFEFTNLIPLTMPVYPPLSLEVVWQLIAHLSFQFKNLAEVETLKQIVLAYDFAGLAPGRNQGLGKKVAESMLSLQTLPEQHFIRGEIFYGKRSILSLQEDGFLNSGEIDLFGEIMATILQEHAPFNSFHELTIKGVLSGISLTWT